MFQGCKTSKPEHDPDHKCWYCSINQLGADGKLSIYEQFEFPSQLRLISMKKGTTMYMAQFSFVE